MISSNELISRCPLLVVNQDHGFESRTHHQMEQSERAEHGGCNDGTTMNRHVTMYVELRIPIRS
jgi:hypothetical protein